MSCGWLFNKHKWVHVHRGHRLCRKCGKTQYLMDSSQGSWWATWPFDHWLNNLKSMQKWDQRYEGVGSKEAALEWFKGQFQSSQ